MQICLGYCSQNTPKAFVIKKLFLPLTKRLLLRPSELKSLNQNEKTI